MVKYKCNFCGKADIPTQAGLKVHIQLLKAGCWEAMERQTNLSLSPENDTRTTGTWTRQEEDWTSDSNDASIDHGDVLNDDFSPFVLSLRRVDSPETELAEN
jgi:hypothetical protein